MVPDGQSGTAINPPPPKGGVRQGQGWPAQPGEWEGKNGATKLPFVLRPMDWAQDLGQGGHSPTT